MSNAYCVVFHILRPFQSEDETVRHPKTPTNCADNQNMKSSKNPFELALPPAVIAAAVAYVMRAIGIGWELTGVLMFIAFVIAFRINIRERRSPQ